MENLIGLLIINAFLGAFCSGKNNLCSPKYFIKDERMRIGSEFVDRILGLTNIA